MSAADASSVTMTSLSPNWPLTRLLVWKNTLILNSSVKPGMQMEKKQGARFLSRLECSVMKFTSKLMSAGATLVRCEALKTPTTVELAISTPKKKVSAGGLFLYKTHPTESSTYFVILRG